MSAGAAVPHLVYLDYPAWAQTRQDYRKGDQAPSPGSRNSSRGPKPPSAVPITSAMGKTGVSASGDPHDYLTIAPDFWPAPPNSSASPSLSPRRFRNHRCRHLARQLQQRHRAQYQPPVFRHRSRHQSSQRAVHLRCRHGDDRRATPRFDPGDAETHHSTRPASW
jgi:hypothetical protein